jgi:hypothetical protein
VRSPMSKAEPAGWCRAIETRFKTFEPLAQAIGQELSGRSAILDGEIVRPGPDGRPMFYELMRRRGPFCFYAFDLLWLDGRDLRDRPLSEWKTLLRKLLPRPSRSVLYVNHFASDTDLFRVICEQAMEGVVAKTRLWNRRSQKAIPWPAGLRVVRCAGCSCAPKNLRPAPANASPTTFVLRQTRF